MPVTPTYDLIASNVLTSSASSVTFSSIPATYRDLVVVCDVKSSTGNPFGYIRLNNDSGVNSYPGVLANGDGTTAASTSGTYQHGFFSGYFGIDATTSTLAIFQIMDYSATNKHKTFLARGNRSNAGTEMAGYRWANTAAVNRVDLLVSSENFAAGSTFYLYGIAG